MSKLKPIAVILLLSSLAFGSLYAADKKEEAKTPDFQITGEAPEGDGYKLYFNKEKSTYFKFSGYSRMVWNFNTPKSKLTLPYFRFLIDGKKNDQFEFHTRLDYSNSFTMSKQNTSADIAKGKGQGYGAPSIYFARAYMTYLISDNFKIDAGRIIQFHYRYDILSAAHSETPVGLGISPHYTNGDFTADFSLLHITDNQEMEASEEEAVYTGGRLAYSNILAKDVKLSYGLAYHSNHKQVRAKYHQIMPDITLNLPNDFYILTQTMVKFIEGGGKNNKIQSYNEIGTNFTDKLAIDTFANIFKNDIADTYYDLGVDASYKFTPSITGVYTVTFGDVFENIPDNTASRKPMSEIFLHVYF